METDFKSDGLAKTPEHVERRCESAPQEEFRRSCRSAEGCCGWRGDTVRLPWIVSVCEESPPDKPVGFHQLPNGGSTRIGGAPTPDEFRAKIRLQFCRAFDGTTQLDKTDFDNEIVETSAEIEAGQREKEHNTEERAIGRQIYLLLSSPSILPIFRCVLLYVCCVQSCSICIEERQARLIATSPGSYCRLHLHRCDGLRSARC